MLRRRSEPARLRSGLGKLLAAHREIDFAYLFGPLAGGLAYYDLEVAVFLRPAPAPDTVSEHETDLSVELTRTLQVDVDVHVLNYAPRGFRHAVLQGRPLLVRDEERLIAFIAEVGPEAAELAYLDEFDLWDVLTQPLPPGVDEG